MSTVADLPASARLLSGPGNEWEGSQDEQTREESFVWAVPWGDSNAFYAALVGNQKAITSGNYTINRRIPLQHPYNPNLYAKRVSWQGKDSPAKGSSVPFAWVILRVTFGYLGYNVSGDESGDQSSGSPPFAKVTAKGGTRTVTDTSRVYTYKNSPNSLPVYLSQNVGRSFPSTVYEVELYCLPDIDQWQAAIAPLNGMVNSQDLQIGAFTRAAGTVMLDGYGFEINYNVVGDAQWTGYFSLNCSSLPWNSFFAGGKIVTLTPAPFPTADLSPCWQ